MTNSTIYIAAAGAGKTTFILRQAIKLYQRGLPEGKKILIVTYTDNNQNHIRQKFLNEYGFIPKDIVILGWFTFLLVYWIRPFKGTVIEQLYDRHIGMSFVEGISGIKKSSSGRITTTYHKNEEKFLDSSLNHLYSDKIAEFAYKCWEQNKVDLLDRMSNIADAIFIDESQDLTAWDFEIMKTLIRSEKIDCILCGDPRQRTYKTSASSKYSKYSGNIALFAENEINQKKKKFITIDTTTLSRSHRCDVSICDFASSILPNFPVTEMCLCEECTNSREVYALPKGVFFVKEKDVQRFVDLYNPLSLIWNKKVEVKSQTEFILNWGESKGLQADATLIYMTKVLIDRYRASKKLKREIPQETLHKFYVAVTRAKYAVGLVVPNNFDEAIISLPFWRGI